MEETIFFDKSLPPDDHEVMEALGVFYDFFRELLEISCEYNHEWRFPGKKHGWLVKAEKKRKGLFWLTPMYGSYKIGFILREQERQALLHESSDPVICDALRHAVPYPEGYGLSFIVSDVSLHITVRKLLTDLMRMRK